MRMLRDQAWAGRKTRDVSISRAAGMCYARGTLSPPFEETPVTETPSTPDPLKTPPPPATPQQAQTPVPLPTTAPGTTAQELIADLLALKSRAEDLVSHLEGVAGSINLQSIEGRLHAAEMALASLAGPTLTQDAHDGLGLLHKWWADIKEEFHLVAGDHKAEKAGALKAAQEAAKVKPAT